MTWPPQKDLEPQGDPEIVDPLPDGTTLIGLSIRGVKGASMLGIREDELGRPTGCSIGIVVEVRHPFRDQWPDEDV